MPSAFVFLSLKGDFTMSKYNTITDFVTADRKLRQSLESNSAEFLTHVKSGLELFHGKGNHNIQIVNDMLDTASAGRLPRNKIIDWLAPIVGHKVEKVDTGFFRFGSKKEDVTYEGIIAEAPVHFTNFPSWEEFKRAADPDAFEADKIVKRQISALTRKIQELTEHGYMAAAQALTVARDSLKTAMNQDGFLAVAVNDEAPEMPVTGVQAYIDAQQAA